MDISYLTSIVKIELALFESTSVAYISILQIITWSIKQNFETWFFVETLDLDPVWSLSWPSRVFVHVWNKLETSPN